MPLCNLSADEIEIEDRTPLLSLVGIHDAGLCRAYVRGISVRPGDRIHASALICRVNKANCSFGHYSDDSVSFFRNGCDCVLTFYKGRGLLSTQEILTVRGERS